MLTKMKRTAKLKKTKSIGEKLTIVLKVLGSNTDLHQKV